MKDTTHDIDKYVLGQMNDEEEIAFGVRLLNEPELQREVWTTRLLQEALETAGPDRTPRTVPLRWAVAAVASCIAVIGAQHHFYSTQASQGSYSLGAVNGTVTAVYRSEPREEAVQLVYTAPGQATTVLIPPGYCKNVQSMTLLRAGKAISTWKNVSAQAPRALSVQIPSGETGTFEVAVDYEGMDTTCDVTTTYKFTVQSTAP